MGLVIYLIGLTIYAATYMAYINAHSDDVRLVDRYGDWEFGTMMGLLLGTILWPLAIPCLILYKIAYKFFEKK